MSILSLGTSSDVQQADDQRKQSNRIIAWSHICAAVPVIFNDSRKILAPKNHKKGEETITQVRAILEADTVHCFWWFLPFTSGHQYRFFLTSLMQLSAIYFASFWHNFSTSNDQILLFCIHQCLAILICIKSCLLYVLSLTSIYNLSINMADNRMVQKLLLLLFLLLLMRQTKEKVPFLIQINTVLTYCCVLVLSMMVRKNSCSPQKINLESPHPHNPKTYSSLSLGPFNNYQWPDLHKTVKYTSFPPRHT